ncbi:MAG: hypothetical protein OEV81_07790 [Betaproteobacteria bacterium]|nr:hypothetical protein [Betaproteobacteria bacterium]MDH5220471.1 hypothetical protein [Betaproteobacteria bacterium]MDH5350172.1 hypothetical protein [Betaproteobacteria bacterium]
MTSSLATPVLLLAFNRPETTARVFEAIREARPARLYVAADGPRLSRAGEAERCAEVRRLATAVDWPCRVQTLFRAENLGCKHGVSTAIDWFFSREERGIVLEDDCLPSQSFFRFAGELLERMKDDPRVFAIQGSFFGSAPMPRASYLYSKMFYMWGWASWADRWRSVNVETLDLAGIRGALDKEHWLGAGYWLRNYWLDVVDRQAAGKIDSWGNPVLFHCFSRRLYNVTPTRNLVLNIGLGPSATRTASLALGPFHREAQDADFPLVHCARYEGPEAMFRFEQRWRAQLTPWVVFRQVMHRKFPRLYAALRGALQAARPGGSSQ